MSNIHVFTSASNNYIPKARVLAKSIKKFHPDFHFHLVLCDKIREKISSPNDENIDSLLLIEELPIPDFESWAFCHSVVELCTAAKGIAFQEIAKQYKCEKIIYLDPDTVLFNPLDEVVRVLDQNHVILTPHILKPQLTEEAILHYEISCLKHGIFNLGFLAIKLSEESQQFIDWWSNRLLNFCYDEIIRGLFTDQRWIDLAPVFFPNVHILRKPNYNVAVWNLIERSITGNITEGIFVDNLPLIFYHFTGFDNNLDVSMLEKYKLSRLVADLRKWYDRELKDMGQEDYSKIVCAYSEFDNGTQINNLQRVIYRNSKNLKLLFPNPFITKNEKQSYYDWYSENKEDILHNKLSLSYEDLSSIPVDSLISLLHTKVVEIEAFKSSKFWKLRQFYWNLKKKWS